MALHDPRSLDLGTLPSVPLHKRKTLPNIPALYFVLNEHRAILYIGLAQSLCLRWVAHHRLEDVRTLPCVEIAWLHIADTHLLPTLEKAYIAHFKPPLNGRCGYRPHVHLHLKTDRAVRDRLLGALRARGTTMQQFFDTFMRLLIEHPEYIDQIEQWADDAPDDSSVLMPASASG
jgi:hypothetical protein